MRSRALRGAVLSAAFVWSLPLLAQTANPAPPETETSARAEGPEPPALDKQDSWSPAPKGRCNERRL